MLNTSSQTIHTLKTPHGRGYARENWNAKGSDPKVTALLKISLGISK